jgi:hypothetical protein
VGNEKNKNPAPDLNRMMINITPVSSMTSIENLSKRKSWMSSLRYA